LDLSSYSMFFMTPTLSIVDPFHSYPVSFEKSVKEGRGVYSWKLVAARMAELCWSVIILLSYSLYYAAIFELR
jgi:hypothetical protein